MSLTKAELEDARRLLRYYQVYYAPKEELEVVDSLIQRIQDELEQEG